MNVRPAATARMANKTTTIHGSQRSECGTGWNTVSLPFSGRAHRIGETVPRELRGYKSFRPGACKSLVTAFTQNIRLADSGVEVLDEVKGALDRATDVVDEIENEE